MSRETTWRLVLASCLATLCLIGWAVVEGVRWAAGLMGCV